MDAESVGYGLEGKRALVCGSTQGIGRACAMRLAALGAEVTLMARDEAALKSVLGELPAVSHGNHAYLVADFSDPKAVAGKFSDHLAKTGPIQILVNNTGGPAPGPIVEAEPDAFLAAMNMHLICNQLLLQAALPGMKEAKYGRVINVISTSVKEPIAGLGVSNTTRWAVASWAKTCAGELGAHGITVNNVLPGFTDTGRLRAIISRKAGAQGVTEDDVSKQMKAQIPVGRFAGPEEVAAAVGFLASPAASYINGINVPVDGGRLSSL